MDLAEDKAAAPERDPVAKFFLQFIRVHVISGDLDRVNASIPHSMNMGMSGLTEPQLCI